MNAPTYTKEYIICDNSICKLDLFSLPRNRWSVVNRIVRGSAPTWKGLPTGPADAALLLPDPPLFPLTTNRPGPAAILIAFRRGSTG